MQIVQSVEESRWRSFVEAHPDSSVFHTPEMFEVFFRTKGFTPRLWAAVDEAGDLLALLLPVEITMREGTLKHFTTRATVFGSILFETSPTGEEAAHTLLQEYGRSNHADRTFPAGPAA